ncbi:E3 ubiquitin-protein ligase COP1 isoform X4 [Homo sapiens]|uniref:E3 ubiquitin-protein ligase COP1 isoform X4 n=1 Tax=Homo sapiens TaxID=9606 RepID=UPI0007DC76F6|nr:E3 ubiquitin-protein ligase COP1 isoform X4 [Homo sapiens]XP_054194160.1 E3 ubiquitin-protein ligase COP1 isoform X4 [Homo sapiens]|eukprot:XP_016857551.1 E3 ubiquitin-protein ligase RFWD2 isoform X4 [Homo sapiens]
MSGSRQAGSGSAGTSPGSSAASSVTSASSSLSSSPSPPSVAVSAAALVSGGVAQAAGSGGLGGPVRPVLVAPAVSGSGGGAVSTGLSRHSCAARPSAGVGGSSSSLGSGSRKRPLLAPLCNGLINSYEDKSNDFVCPICFDMIEEAYMTKCGHSFCYKCIHQSLEDNNRCPKCNYVVDNIDHLYPNFLVNELILKQKQRFEEKRFKLDHSVSSTNGHRWQIFQDWLGTDQDNLDLANVNLMLELLVQKKKQLEAESHAAQLQILMEFLKVARRNKREEMSGLYSPVSEDSTVPQFEAPSPSHSLEFSSDMHRIFVNGILIISIIDSTEYSQPPGFSGSSQTKKQPWYNSTLASRRKRLTAHFEDLEQCYFSTRMSRISDDSRTASQLDEFQECLSKFTRYNSVRPLATLSYASDLYNGSSIVSSIEFDRDCDYFAIAGVTKKIKVYEYDTVIQDAVDIHYPENEMTCNSKISCISWSSYHKNLLASSDYEGTVILWDGFTGQRSKVYQEHEKRCWSVDFNLMDPKLLASGSDDAKVKLWSTNLDNSVASIEAKANVCCVKFSPSSRYHLAFGCADHCVHYYDLRNTKQPIMVFKGHRKAVSYAKFVSGEEIVSASTDSQLKLWNVGKPYCLRSFKGHINEKNFVGLASNGDYIACGSENNSLYLYYKGLSKTLLTFKFDTVKSVLDKDRKEDDTNEFVSAVCWRALPDGYPRIAWEKQRSHLCHIQSWSHRWKFRSAKVFPTVAAANLFFLYRSD